MRNIVYTFRNILKNKTNSIITITGLSVAFACLLLIFLYVTQEFNYNNFHANKNNIFRINYTIKWVDGGTTNSTLLNPEFSQILKEKVPQVKYSTAYRSAQKQTMSFEHQTLEETLSITEPDFFDMFSFRVLYGNPNQMLKNPDEVVITKSLAEKLCTIGNHDIEALLGKTVTFMNTGNQPFVISGIMEDIPKNSTLQFNALIPYKYEEHFSTSRNMVGNSTIFYQTSKIGNLANIEAQVSAAVLDYNQELIERFKGYKAFADTDKPFQPFTINLQDTHLSALQSDYEINNNKTSLYVLSSIGLLILVIASGNFIMLTLGQVFRKVGEVRIRSTLGAGKINIFGIFFSESLILSFTAFTLGTVLCYLLLPTFKTLAPNKIFINLIHLPKVILFVVGCLLLISFSTSITPVFKLNNIKPNLLPSKKLHHGKGNNVTRILVTLQYGLSILLIILAVSVIRQTNYMKHVSLGFPSENIINLRTYHLSASEKTALRDQLARFPGISDFTFTDRDYTGGRSSDGVRKSNGDNIETRILNVDNNYIETLGLKLVAGNNFNELSSNGNSVIVNEKLLAALERNEDAIGSTIMMSGENYRIIGVVKDFHYDSMKEEIMPLMLRQQTNNLNRGNFIFIKYQPQQLASLLPFIRNTWKKITPDKELDLNFWDEQLSNRYQNEERWSQIIGYAAIIAIIISSIGLFGLTLMTVNTRKKEIGIRKINGARVGEVITMLNKDFVKWVGFAFVIATPLAYYAMYKWLENFAYKTSLSWWIFALAGVLALCIALLTVSWQSWRAATRNPVEALRYE
ncbi:ABC transporter permease [Maribellus maritimus]|uniref:ABC transporter permease n=1 Tax=Maribellus maritimus TaxID=2870838 RepID=UPI001EEA2CF9|nr:ABC transporter permease [Maribellus maritimus]MCG6189793.1 ABC transporter permease [Maribellus maritimus]